MDTETARILDQMVATLVDRWRPERIILFGSQATGRAGMNSDIDLLVVISDEAYYRNVSVDMRRALDQFPSAKDIVVARHSTVERKGNVIGTVYREALREGRTLYASA